MRLDLAEHDRYLFLRKFMLQRYDFLLFCYQQNHNNNSKKQQHCRPNQQIPDFPVKIAFRYKPNYGISTCVFVSCVIFCAVHIHPCKPVAQIYGFIPVRIRYVRSKQRLVRVGGNDSHRQYQPVAVIAEFRFLYGLANVDFVLQSADYTRIETKLNKTAVLTCYARIMVDIAVFIIIQHRPARFFANFR